jgi:hypothetical protein
MEVPLPNAHTALCVADLHPLSQITVHWSLANRLYEGFNYTTVVQTNTSLTLMLQPGQRWIHQDLITASHPSRGVFIVGFSVQHASLPITLPQPVQVATVVATPYVELNRGILHPTTPTLVLRGRSLGGNDLAFVFNTGIIKNTHYSVAVNADGTVTLTLLAGKRWLGSQAYGSMPLRVEQLTAHRGVYRPSIEVGVALQAHCFGGNCGNPSAFAGGLFVCDWANRRLKQLTGSNGATDFGARPTLGDAVHPHPPTRHTVLPRCNAILMTF